jgi:hypothetical protein
MARKSTPGRYPLILRKLPQGDWDTYLMAESGLPGPRANLELIQAAVDEANEGDFRRWLSTDTSAAAGNTPATFLVVCGTVGLGRLVAEGIESAMPELRRLASDSRWRIREGVAMALQRLGDADMPRLLREMAGWSAGNAYEQRAVVAGLCEPRLLAEPKHAEQVLSLLDRITQSLSQSKDRSTDGFRVLRQALAYGWSVAIVAAPGLGKRLMEQWLDSLDKDVQWLMRENLKKNRLARLDSEWVRQMKSKNRDK